MSQRYMCRSYGETVHYKSMALRKLFRVYSVIFVNMYANAMFLKELTLLCRIYEHGIPI